MLKNTKQSNDRKAKEHYEISKEKEKEKEEEGNTKRNIPIRSEVGENRTEGRKEKENDIKP